MNKKAVKKQKPVAGLASQEKISSAKYKEITGVTAQQDFFVKFREISNLLWYPSDTTAEERDHKIARALELYEGLNPTDSLEGMLALQMIGTHDAGLECLRRAAIPEQPVDIKDMYLKHAQKLLDLHLKQVAALDKRRGNGQQKIIVERVNVGPGGKAFVGSVEQGKGDLPEKSEPAAIEHAEIQDVEDLLETARAANAKKGVRNK